MDNLTSNQISEWEAYNKLEPIGEWRADFRMAFIASVIINTTRAVWSKKGTPMIKVEDLMPHWDKEDEQQVQSLEEMKQILHTINREFNNPKAIRRKQYLKDTKKQKPKSKNDTGRTNSNTGG